MIEEVRVSVARRRTRVLAGLGTVDCVTLRAPSEPRWSNGRRMHSNRYMKSEGSSA